MLRVLFLAACIFASTFSNNKVLAKNSYDSLEISIRPYVSLRGHLAFYDKKFELQENTSCAGSSINIKKGILSFIATVEVQINLFRGNSSFNADGNLSGEFLSIHTSQTHQVLGNRLGSLGISMGKYGSLTFGKQWSVYRDITAYTDKFNVFGSRASATFIGGTDGGSNGTGRADQSIIYRNQIGPLHISSQTQARGGRNGNIIDGFGFSAQLEVGKNLLIGSAYNRAFLSTSLLNSGQILGLTGHPTYISFGLQYIKNKFQIGLVSAFQENGDFTKGFYKDSVSGSLYPTVVFNAKGLEIFAKYSLRKFSIMMGYNLYMPSVDRVPAIHGQPLLSKEFRSNDLIIGVYYQFMAPVYIYSEQRISFGQNAVGETDKSVFTMGMKIDLAKTFYNK